MLLMFLFTSCVKDPLPQEPEDPDPVLPTEIHFSILGDSYSTFQGYVTPGSNDVWPYYENIGVTEVGQMWWYQVSQATGWILDCNNSFSGSLISNMNYGNYFGPHSFLRRMDDLGDPDVILVFGGTNDIWDGVPMGEYLYGNWTEEGLCTFRPALACLFDGLRSHYPKAKIWFMADCVLGDEFLESVHTIATHYEVPCIELRDITKDWDHPNVAGMTDIATQVLAAVQEPA